jgi:hypothetical protein
MAINRNEKTENSVLSEKQGAFHHNEYTLDEEGRQVKVDYSGATEKTDPAEIKLVKKLDWWIMPTLWAMYWLNYLVRNLLSICISLLMFCRIVTPSLWQDWMVWRRN